MRDCAILSEIIGVLEDENTQDQRAVNVGWNRPYSFSYCTSITVSLCHACRRVNRHLWRYSVHFARGQTRKIRGVDLLEQLHETRLQKLENGHYMLSRDYSRLNDAIVKISD